MPFAKPHTGWSTPIFFIIFLLTSLGAPAQESSNQGIIPRTDRPEISVTVRDRAGAMITAAGTVKLYRDGTPAGSAALSRGRAFFGSIPFGSYTVVIEATGYKSAQRDVNVSISMPYEVDATLQRDSADENAGGPAKPLLTPKAAEALEKTWKALGKNKLSEAEKHLNEALQLAPSHPDVLYAQGVLFLHKQNPTEAQSALEKASQMDPSNAGAFSALCMALADQGKYEQAIAPAEKSLQLDAKAWEPQWVLGEAYYHLQQYDQALKASQQAWTASNGKDPRIELLVAKSQTAVGQYEDAAQSLRDLVKRYSDHPEAETARRYLDRLAKDGKIHSN
ncbi:MAG TPA: tetratricopeptide repeat protein [Candidatus Binatia bacterium]|nr:tetratricopeptide repeat protein [Candidatus Binatia bacterium]